MVLNGLQRARESQSWWPWLVQCLYHHGFVVVYLGHGAIGEEGEKKEKQNKPTKEFFFFFFPQDLATCNTWHYR
jgi:hypothetical protein